MVAEHLCVMFASRWLASSVGSQSHLQDYHSIVYPPPGTGEDGEAADPAAKSGDGAADAGAICLLISQPLCIEM